LVSIIIPTYKRARIVSETIQAVLNQTYSDWEAIVVSDGPSDDTRKVVEAFADSRIKYYEIAHNGRPAVPRNFGISKTQGQYLAFCDDDDTWLPEKLALQLAKFDEDRDIGLVYTKCLFKRGKKERTVPYNCRGGFIFNELFLSFGFIASSTVLVKKEVINEVGIFDEDVRLKATEDFDLWLRIAHKHKVGCVDKPLLIYRSDSDNNISRGVLGALRRQYLISWRFYRKNYVGLGLFLKKSVSIFFKSIFELMYQR